MSALTAFEKLKSHDEHANIHGQVTSLHPLRIADRSRQTTIIKGLGYRYKVSPQSTNKLFQS